MQGFVGRLGTGEGAGCGWVRWERGCGDVRRAPHLREVPPRDVLAEPALRHLGEDLVVAELDDQHVVQRVGGHVHQPAHARVAQRVQDADLLLERVLGLADERAPLDQLDREGLVRHGRHQLVDALGARPLPQQVVGPARAGLHEGPVRGRAAAAAAHPERGDLRLDLGARRVHLGVAHVREHVGHRGPHCPHCPHCAPTPGRGSKS